MTNDESHDVLAMPRDNTPDGPPQEYLRNLRERRDELAAENPPPPFDAMLEAARSREGSYIASSVGESRSRRGRRSVTVLSTAAAVVAVLVGLAVAMTRGGQPVRVEVAGPDSPASNSPAPDSDAGGSGGRSNAGRRTAGPSGLEHLPLLFPPGSVNEMQARIGADPEVDDTGFVVAGNLEVFIAGSEGEPAQLVTVLSVLKADTEKAFGLMNMPREFAETLAADGPLDSAVLESGLESAFPSTALETRELVIADLATEGPMFGAWVRRWVGSQIDSRIVLIPTRTATTVVMASNTDGSTVDGILAGLTIEGDLLRVGDVPDGFDRLLDRSDRVVLTGDAYAVMAPPAVGLHDESGPKVPTRLAVNDGPDAASAVLLWNDLFINQSRPFIVREHPWVIGTLDPAVAMGGTDDAWVSIGDFTIRGRTDLDDSERVASSVTELRRLWEGIQPVEPSVFDHAIERYHAAEVNLFGDTPENTPETGDRARATTRITTTTVSGNSGD